MELFTLRPKVRNKKPKRLGRGPGSGWGKTSGRGHKGAGQRKGKKLPYVGFRGGNLPYSRVIPKRGFKSPRKKEYQLVNLRSIESKIKTVAEVNPQVLKELNLIKDAKKPVKILGDIKEKLSKKLTFKADRFSAKAKSLIEDSGGKIECLDR